MNKFFTFVENYYYYIFIFLSIFILYLFLRRILEYTISNKLKCKIRNKTDRIVLSLTTSPNRINSIERVLNSISYEQNLKPDLIYLNLPKIFKRDNSIFQKIPEFIKNNTLININWCEDIGPATKILYTAKLEKKLSQSDNTIIISIDDDTIYPPDFIEEFYKYCKEYPNAVITGTSFIPYKTINNVKYVELLEGFSGVAYRVNFIEDFDLSFFKTTIKECYLGDDFVLSNYIRSKNIPIIVIGTKNKMIKKIKQLEYGYNKDALHMNHGGNNNNYIKCANYLKNNNSLFIENTYKFKLNNFLEKIVNYIPSLKHLLLNPSE